MLVSHSVVETPGWRADWLNAWLAAIGITFLIDGLRLSWSGGASPAARFHFEGDANLASAIAEALNSIRATSIAGCDLRREATVNEFREMARIARATGDFSLGAAVTDLAVPRNAPDNVAASRFYVAGTGPMGTLALRHRRVRELIGSDAAATIHRSLAGRASRLTGAGLGFDVTRIALGDQAGEFGEQRIDPVVETLALYGLAAFPVRGDGQGRSNTRGWRDGRFRWLTWSRALDFYAIDAVMAHYYSTAEPPIGVGAGTRFESVQYSPRSQADPTRGYASRRLT